MPSLQSLITQKKQLEEEMIYWESMLTAAPEGRLISRSQPNGTFKYSYVLSQ